MIAAREQLSLRAGSDWELYRKSGQSREIVATRESRSEFWRREEGWAARWWQQGVPRFACGSDPENLRLAIECAARVPASPAPIPQWPRSKSAEPPAPSSLEAPPDLFEDLTRQVSINSRGEALLTRLAIRSGGATEWIENGVGLAVAQNTGWMDGLAVALGRRGARACEARLVFRWEREPDSVSLARRLVDRAILPLSERSTPFERGEWLLDPSIGAALLAGIAPLFSAARPPRWLVRSRLANQPVTLIDDATADAPFDGEGTKTQRVVLVDGGEMAGRLQDLRTAAQTESRSTGHGVRPSYRVAPAVGPRRLFLETSGGTAPLELLASVRRGLFASALTAPAWVDLENDRFEIEFTGIAVVAGRAQMSVAGARARGRISQLLRRIRAVATDLQFFPMPYPIGAPTLLVERADFD